MSKKELELAVGNYTLHADSECYWITKKVKTTKHNAKKEYREVKVAGYVRHFEDLVADLVEGTARNSTVKDFEHYIKEIDKSISDGKKIVREYAKTKVQER